MRYERLLQEGGIFVFWGLLFEARSSIVRRCNSYEAVGDDERKGNE